jgi:N6-L-threonylcarbamoyladenine synthase
MDGQLTFLGIESSCDDTGAAIVRHQPGKAAEILSNVVASQTELHAAFGGVVPEIAARAHVEKLDLMIEAALMQAGLQLADLDGIAVTAGPAAPRLRRRRARAMRRALPSRAPCWTGPVAICRFQG